MSCKNSGDKYTSDKENKFFFVVFIHFSAYDAYNHESGPAGKGQKVELKDWGKDELALQKFKLHLKF